MYARGRRYNGSILTIFACPNRYRQLRLGLTVTRKVGGAAVRNRVKRRLREVFRRHRAALDDGLDLVVNAHPAMVGQSYRDIEREFVRGLERLTRRCGR